jgi:Zn-dependent protease with chaperone function
VCRVCADASGVHDALTDPEGKKKQLLSQVLSSSGDGANDVLDQKEPDSRLVTRLGNEVVAAAREALALEIEELQGKGPEAEDELERARSQLRTLQHNWQFVVIDNGVINAFVTDVLPGYVFIHRGLIELMRKHPEQLSFIIGHELSHHILDHNEQTRTMQAGLSLLQLLVIVAVDPTGLLAFLMELGAMGTFLSYTMMLPSSRGHESEADALGLQLVVRACRDPHKAIQAHKTLAAYEEKMGHRPSRSTSLGATHPATLKRLDDLQELLPEAIKQYNKSGCKARKSQLWRSLRGNSIKS